MSEATLFERPAEACLEAARAQVERLAEPERQRRDPGVNERERSARERVEQALPTCRLSHRVRTPPHSLPQTRDY